MKCEDVQKELIAYVAQRASAAEKNRIEAHLATCAACRARVEEFGNIFSVLDEVPSIEPSFGFDARVRQRIAAEPRGRWFTTLVPAPRLVFAAVFLVAVGVWVSRLPLSNPGAPPTVAVIQQQDFNAIQNLGVLENYDVVTKMDALSELAPAATAEPGAQQQSGSSSND